ncbi:hypothetical protein [Arenibaculum sp.]|uniref:hypothetical protein n=1 Tax=Arenibaculum sp. TaxID=2865862 RepID=UPI002E10B267|nr:hypothetical protein [Arenibaculum sp.]
MTAVKTEAADDLPKQVIYGRDAQRALGRPAAATGRPAEPEIRTPEWKRFEHGMTTCRAGGRTFVVGMGRGERPFGSCRYGWFIQELLPDGSVGEVTQTGGIDRLYSTLCSYVANGRTYVFCHAADGNHWFIRELRENGTFGPQTHSGSFGSHYPVACAVKAGPGDYVFGTCGSGFWFLRHLHADGTLGREAHTGTSSRDDRLATVCSAVVGGRTFLMGQAANREFFVWEITSDGRRSARPVYHGGKWRPYAAFSAFETPCGAYLIGQGEEKWFVAPIAADGSIGGETDFGDWAGVYGYLAGLSASCRVEPPGPRGDGSRGREGPP